MASPQISRGMWLVLTCVPAGLLLVALTSLDMVPITAAVGLAAAMLLPVVWIGRRVQPRDKASLETNPLHRVERRKAVEQDILDCLPEPALLVDGSRQVIAVNRAAKDILEVTETGRDLALSLRHPTVLTAVETLRSGGPPVVDEITVPAPSPRTFTLYASSLPNAEDPGRARVLLLLQDATQAKRAEQSRADFVANASHELRSPLSALIGFIETLRGPASDDATARERFLALMHGEALRMARLIDDLMSLSRVELNEHVPPRDLVDLAEILATVVDTLTGRAEARQMSIALECPPKLPAVIGDDDQLIQVFHNLLDNAIKYARADSQIRIVVEVWTRLAITGSPGVAVKVMDQSDGIPSIHLPRLTERFYRADDGRARRLGGTGLGLAIVKHIVNRHRGRLMIESEGNVGSTFTVVLPVLPGTDISGDAAGGSQSKQRTPSFIKM